MDKLSLHVLFLGWYDSIYKGYANSIYVYNIKNIRNNNYLKDNQNLFQTTNHVHESTYVIIDKNFWSESIFNEYK